MQGRHPVSIGHLVMGVAFLGLAVVWSLIAGDVVQDDDIRFLLPLPWVLGGLAGLTALVTSERRRNRRSADNDDTGSPGSPGSPGTGTMER